MNITRKIDELVGGHGDHYLSCVCADQTHVEYCYITEKSGEVRYIVCDFLTELQVNGVKLNIITKNAIVEKYDGIIVVHGVQ